MIDFGRLEATIRRDPGERGLASYRDAEGLALCAGHLERASRGLAACAAGRVLIVTGFCILTDERPVAETDGPLGAVYLAERLRAAGFETAIAAEDYATYAVEAAFSGAGIEEPPPIFRFASYGRSERRGAADESWRELVHREGFSHLVAIERVGPSYDDATIGAEDRETFLAAVPREHRGARHNMRGVSIDEGTVALDRLFELSAEPSDRGTRPATIGIVDGGNEVGCGAIPWSVLRKAIKQGPAERTACRVATDSTIVAGVSNWGAYALGGAVAALRRGMSQAGAEAIGAWPRERLQIALEAMVRHGGAVDGVTKRPEATVDGLPLETELSMFEEIQAITGCGQMTNDE